MTPVRRLAPSLPPLGQVLEGGGEAAGVGAGELAVPGAGGELGGHGRKLVGVAVGGEGGGEKAGFDQQVGADLGWAGLQQRGVEVDDFSGAVGGGLWVGS